MSDFKLYFEKESPDWNMMIDKGDPQKIAANRVVLSIMTEFGMVNDYRMSQLQYSAFILTTQTATHNEPKSRPKYKKSKHRKVIVSGFGR